MTDLGQDVRDVVVRQCRGRAGKGVSGASMNARPLFGGDRFRLRHDVVYQPADDRSAWYVQPLLVEQQVSREH